MYQIGQRIRPKSPNRAQHGGKGAEKQDCAPQRTQHRKSPQFSFRRLEKKKERRHPYRQTVKAVQKARQAGHPQPERPQQIIQQSGGKAQQNGLAKHQHLLGDLIPHRLSEQPAKPAAPAAALLLIRNGVDAPVHMELPAVQG